jgi:hypothetical protein
MTPTRLILIASIAATSLGGCASVRQALGSEKLAPDEFRVVSKAPLVVPPEFNLRPPRPGEARPMELRADLQARTAVFGVQMGVAASEGEKLLVARAGGTNADPRDRILGRTPSAPTQPANPLMSEAEAERQRLEQQSIRNATGGQPVTIQQNRPRGFKLPGM